jgi:hypothetical protein
MRNDKFGESVPPAKGNCHRALYLRYMKGNIE